MGLGAMCGLPTTASFWDPTGFLMSTAGVPGGSTSSSSMTMSRSDSSDGARASSVSASGAAARDTGVGGTLVSGGHTRSRFQKG